MDMLKSKEGLAEEVKSLRARLQSSRDQNSVLSDQLLLLQKECKNLLNSISGYEESNHKLSSQVARLSEKNSTLKKKLRQAVTACADIKKQAESYISSIQSRFYEQLNREGLEGHSIGSSFRYDGPAISVSERENDSSIARFDNEEIILAYTQEIRDKQTEIASLSKSLEGKSLDLENFKINMKTLRETFEKRVQDKDKMINNLQQEVRVLHDEISSIKREKDKTSNTSSTRELTGYRGSEDYVTQIEALQNKLNTQSKKFENYIRTIANLEKQVQLQIVRVSELESSVKALTESLARSEQEKKDFALALAAAEGKVSELESLKIQQAKVINSQSSRLSNSRQGDESSALSLKQVIESLEGDNKRLLEANTFIQSCADSLKASKDSEIANLKQDLAKLQEEETSILNKSLSDVKESPYKDVVLYIIQMLGESDPAGLFEKVKDLVRANKDSPEDLKVEIMSIVKEYSNKVLSTLARISNSVQKANEKLGDFMQKFSQKIIKGELKEKYTQNAINSYEITTVNECSEIEDESFEEDSLEIKLEQSARKIKELNSEIRLLKELLEQKDDLIHDLELKSDRLKIEKEKKQKETNDLHLKIAELENENRTNKEIFEISDKKKTVLINTLEGKITQIKKEIEAQKNSVLSEKEELFDHIIRIEQESKNQSSWYKSQLDDSKAKIKGFEAVLAGIEEYLGSDFNGDHLEAIKSITKKKRRNSFSFNFFKRSSTKSESGSKNGTPTGSEVLSPSASGTASVDYMRVHKTLEQEKMHNLMHAQQIEALREKIRHLEYENSRNIESKIYQNLRGIAIEILKMLPVMGEGVERKIQIMTALLWLSNEEKFEIESMRSRVS